MLLATVEPNVKIAALLGSLVGVWCHVTFVVIAEDYFDADWRLYQFRQGVARWMADMKAARPAVARPAPLRKCAVFVSYRRADARDAVERLYDRLKVEFDAASLFKDVDSMPCGVDFREYIKASIERSEVVLVVIGRKWLDLNGENGMPRIWNPDDYVYIEILHAMKCKKAIVPVLVSDARMPSARELPEAIADLSYRSAFQLRNDPDFHKDADKLMALLASKPWASVA